jgi:hypothetical protein
MPAEDTGGGSFSGARKWAGAFFQGRFFSGAMSLSRLVRRNDH